MSPSQKSSRSNGVILASTVGGIVLLGKRFLKKDKDGKRNILRKLGIGTGVGLALNFASQATTGESFFSLFGKFMNGGLNMRELQDRASNTFGGYRESNPEGYNMVAYPTLANQVFGHMTVGELRALTDNKPEWKKMYETQSKNLRSPYSEDFRQFV